MQIKNFEDLEIWQLARRLAQELLFLSFTQLFEGFRLARSNAKGSGFGHVDCRGIRTWRKPRVCSVPVYRQRFMRRNAISTLSRARARLNGPEDRGQFASDVETIIGSNT